MRFLIFAAILAISLCWADTAKATALESRVAAYNTAAAGLTTLWNDFQTQQGLAFADIDGYYSNIRLYIANSGTNQSAADAYLAAAMDDWDDHRMTTGPDALADLQALLTAFSNTGTALQAVIDADTSDTSAKAYATSNTHFIVPVHPFIVWDNPEYTGYEVWAPFTFPELAVGTNSQTSYASMTLSAWRSLLPELIEGWEDIEWFWEHGDDVQEMWADAANKFNDICAYCAMQIQLVQVADECYTEEGLDDFCEYQASEVCGAHLSNQEKHQALSENSVFGNCHKENMLDYAEDAAIDAVTSYWDTEFSWQ